MIDRPMLERREHDTIAFWTDRRAADGGVALAFTERAGGVSAGAFSSLNLAAHVGDDPASVDRNRRRVLDAIGLGDCRDRLVTAEQIHGDCVREVGVKLAGAGAFAAGGSPPVSTCDALITNEPGVPLMLLFADCVPVVLVGPGPCVGVAHAGWRGALAGIAGKTVESLCSICGCSPSRVRAYVGAHIQACHYSVGEDVMSHFVNTFGTFARADSGGLDLGAVVAASLTDSGVDSCNIARLPACTAEATDRFFSYRAEGGTTGRHGALVCVLPHSL